MEYDDRHLDSLSSSVIEYFNEVLIHKNCVSSTFRKYNIRNNEDVEFSFLLLRSTSDGRKSFYQIDSSCITEKEAKNLVKLSESWRLRLANASIKENKLCLKLNRPHAFYTIIKSIINRKSEYGKCFSKKQTIRITSDEEDVHDLTGYRLSILKNAAVNLLEVGGYEVRDSDPCWIHFTTKNSIWKNEMGTVLKVLCGPVVNSESKMKETEITKEDYHKLRLKDMVPVSENKNIDNQILDSLVDGSIKVSLLQVKSSQALSLNLKSDHSKPRETGSKGGAFLQYNASRLAALRNKYNQMCSEGVYPEISKTEEVNFDLLKEPEEWGLIFNFLLEYPSVVFRLSKEMASGKSNIHQLCDFLLKLCSLFSAYYRRVRILLEPRDHLIQTIQARLLLVFAVEQVLENGLAILNVKKVERM